MRSGPSGFSPVAGGATSLPQPSPYAPAFKETFLGGAGAPSGFAPTTYGGFSGQEYGGQKGLGEYFEAPQVQSYSTPWMQQYANQMGYNTSDPLAFTPFGAQEQKQYLSTGQFDLGKLSESPITAPQAQNQAQAGKMQSTAMQDAMKAIQEATTRSGKLEKMEGFKPEVGRRYSAEKDVAGNVIAEHALATPYEKEMGGLPSGYLEGKSWRAAGSEGGAGHPFTPNLDKFQARQDSNVLAQTMIGQNPSDVAQMRQAVSNAAYDSTNRRAQRAGDLASKGLSQTASGSLEQIQGQRPSSMANITSNVLDTTNEANQALQKGRDVSSQKFNESTNLANRANAQSQSATQMSMQGMNQQYREGQQKGAYKKPDAIAQGFYNASKEMQSQANKTALQSRNLTNQGAKSLEQGAKQYNELKAIPRTEYTQLNSLYGNVYAGKGAESIGQAAAKKIKNKNQN